MTKFEEFKKYIEGHNKIMQVYSERLASTPMFIVDKDRVYLSDGIEMVEVRGVHFNQKERNGVPYLEIKVDDGVKIDTSVRVCMGFVPVGDRVLESDFIVGKNAEVHYIVDCLVISKTVRRGRIVVEDGAKFTYEELHYHGEDGKTVFDADTEVLVGKNAVFYATFVFTEGRVGKSKSKYRVKVDDGGVADFTMKAYGNGDDYIEVDERIYLNGVDSRGVLKSRVALTGNSFADIVNVIEGNGDDAVGHIDCYEVLTDTATAKTTPIAVLNNPMARITHEAAMGRVSRKQLETLMARGLTEDEATDIIVRGMLR